MLIVVIRTIVLFAVTVFFLRLMGKRQIGQLQPYELVVIIMISELAAIPMQDTGIPLISGLIPIFILFASQVTLSYISLKNHNAREIICGKPSILIKESYIQEDEMRKLRYNINDLLEQLRAKGVTNINDVDYAILETSGELSVLFKSHKRPVQPADLGINTPLERLTISVIMDGKIIDENLSTLGLSLNDLENKLRSLGINNLSNVFYASLDTYGNIFYQMKTSPK